MIVQGWLICRDGFRLLERVDVARLVAGDVTVDVQFEGQPPSGWERWADGSWHRNVPAAALNRLMAVHGGVIEAVPSRLDLAPLPEADAA